jgi:hypothetical protein
MGEENITLTITNVSFHSSFLFFFFSSSIFFLSQGGHPLGRAMIRAIGDMTARTARRRTSPRSSGGGNSKTKRDAEEEAALTRRLLQTPMIRSLMAAFAKEIVNDQDVIEAMEADAIAEAEASKARREEEAARSNQSIREAPSTGGSSNASLSSDDHALQSGPYLPRSLRPRGSIYDRTGTIREMLLAKTPSKTPSKTPNRGGRRRSVLGEAHQRTRWTLRLRVQVHEARGLIQAPGVQLLEDHHSGFATVRRGV